MTTGMMFFPPNRGIYVVKSELHLVDGTVYRQGDLPPLKDPFPGRNTVFIERRVDGDYYEVDHPRKTSGMDD